MDGIAGYHGWRWIFIIEGILSAVICLWLFFTFPGFPEQAQWLTSDERNYIQARLSASQNDTSSGESRPVRLRDILTVLRDYKIWLTGIMYMGLVIPAYGYAYFSPAIIASQHAPGDGSTGFSAIHAQLYSVPPWVAAFVASMILATVSDRLQRRFEFAVAPLGVTVAALVVLMLNKGGPQVQYAMLYFVCMGVFSAMPVVGK